MARIAPGGPWAPLQFGGIALRAGCGFTWGFDVAPGGPQIRESTVLDGPAWTEAREHLARVYPDWRVEHLGPTA
jgi:hypothetical protein